MSEEMKKPDHRFFVALLSITLGAIVVFYLLMHAWHHPPASHAPRDTVSSHAVDLSALEKMEAEEKKLDAKKVRAATDKIDAMRMQAEVTAYEVSDQKVALQKLHAPLERSKQQKTVSHPTSTQQAYRLNHPDFLVVQGTVIPAVLNTALDSSLPGMVTATVSEDVFGLSGRIVLIPKGSKLVGQYSAQVVDGQLRVMVVYQRLIRPDQIAVTLASPATGPLGRNGLAADDVNTHFWSRTGQAILLSMLSAGAYNAGVNESDSYNSAAQYRVNAGEALSQSAATSLSTYNQIKPTLSLHQGAVINILTAKDLDFHRALSKGETHE